MPTRSSTRLFWPSMAMAMFCCFAVWRQCNPAVECQCNTHADGR